MAHGAYKEALSPSAKNHALAALVVLLVVGLPFTMPSRATIGRMDGQYHNGVAPGWELYYTGDGRRTMSFRPSTSPATATATRLASGSKWPMAKQSGWFLPYRAWEFVRAASFW